MQPIVIRGLLTPLSSEVTPEIVRRKLDDLGVLQLNVFLEAADGSMPAVGAAPAPKLSHGAQEIFDNVLAAMAEAEGFGSPIGEDYLALMAAISKEAMARIVNVTAVESSDSAAG